MERRGARSSSILWEVKGQVANALRGMTNEGNILSHLGADDSPHCRIWEEMKLSMTRLEDFILQACPEEQLLLQSCISQCKEEPHGTWIICRDPLVLLQFLKEHSPLWSADRDNASNLLKRLHKKEIWRHTWHQCLAPWSEAMLAACAQLPSALPGPDKPLSSWAELETALVKCEAAAENFWRASLDECYEGKEEDCFVAREGTNNQDADEATSILCEWWQLVQETRRAVRILLDQAEECGETSPGEPAAPLCTVPPTRSTSSVPLLPPSMQAQESKHPKQWLQWLMGRSPTPEHQEQASPMNRLVEFMREASERGEVVIVGHWDPGMDLDEIFPNRSEKKLTIMV